MIGCVPVSLTFYLTLHWVLFLCLLAPDVLGTKLISSAHDDDHQSHLLTHLDGDDAAATIHARPPPDAYLLLNNIVFTRKSITKKPQSPPRLHTFASYFCWPTSRVYYEWAIGVVVVMAAWQELRCRVQPSCNTQLDHRSANFTHYSTISSGMMLTRVCSNHHQTWLHLAKHCQAFRC